MLMRLYYRVYVDVFVLPVYVDAFVLPGLC